MSKRLGSRYRSGRSSDWLKFKNPAAPAVRREAEEDWRPMIKGKVRNVGATERQSPALPRMKLRVIGGRLLMPAELQAIHRYVVETRVLETVTDEI